MLLWPGKKLFHLMRIRIAFDHCPCSERTCFSGKTWNREKMNYLSIVPYFNVLNRAQTFLETVI
jgi:hypothetical protein